MPTSQVAYVELVRDGKLDSKGVAVGAQFFEDDPPQKQRPSNPTSKMADRCALPHDMQAIVDCPPWDNQTANDLIHFLNLFLSKTSVPKLLGH